MKLKVSAVSLAVLVAATAAHAQVRVIDEEYQPKGGRSNTARPASALPPATSPAPAASARTVAPVAVMAPQGAPAAGFELPIESADVAVARNNPFLIRRGAPLHAQLQAWARHTGWELLWHPSVSWRAIADADFNQHKDVTAAVEDVVGILRDEGKAIRLRISDGNRIMEVVSNEVRSND